MGYKSQHSPRGLYTEPKLNPRANNKLLIIAVGCANSVENSVFKKKRVFSRFAPPFIENKGPHLRIKPLKPKKPTLSRLIPTVVLSTSKPIFSTEIDLSTPLCQPLMFPYWSLNG